jgi:hypothetical protein
VSSTPKRPTQGEINMRMAAKAGLVGALALTLVAATSIQSAQADRRGRVVGGAGEQSTDHETGYDAAVAGPRYYYAAPSGCGEYRRRAAYNDEIGRPDRAAYWWDRYEACRGR